MATTTRRNITYTWLKATITSLSWGVFVYGKMYVPMRDIQWFRDRIGQTITRNGRDFTIVNQEYADYAWDLQNNGFEYASRI